MSNLNSRELMHMAIHASANGRPDDSVRALKELLEQEPDNAKAHFLLAADFAEIALLNEAVLHYRSTLESSPLMCKGRLAQLETLPAIFGLPAATMAHHSRFLR